MGGSGMRYHKNLSAERLRQMPWKNQVGLVASELSRAAHLRESGGGPEIAGCLQRARELLGVLESVPGVPAEAGLVLAAVAEDLSAARLGEAPAKAPGLYQRLMSLYSA